MRVQKLKLWIDLAMQNMLKLMVKILITSVVKVATFCSYDTEAVA